MNRRWLVCLGLCVVALLAYGNSFGGGFVLDNKALILEDPRLREATPQNLDLIFQHTYWWPHGESGLYRPVTTLSYLLNYAVLGNTDRPDGYHWLNFLLHAGNVLLVYLLASRLIGEFWPPVFAAGLWAVHPVLTESVTNIVGRADLLSAAGILSGLLLYLKSTEWVGWRRGACLAGLMAATATAVFTKESGVVLPGLIALYELVFWRERRKGGDLLFGLLATLPPIAIMLYQRAQVLAGSAPAVFPFLDNPIIGANFWTGRLTAAGVLPRYLLLVIWPAHLSTDYSYAQIPLAAGAWQDWLSWTFLLAVVFLVFLLYRLHRPAFFFAAFAFLTLLPVSNLLFPIGTIMAERFLYLPAAGLAACLVLAVYAACRRVRYPAAAHVLLGLFALACMARTWMRNSDWRDDVSLATSAVESSPRSFKAHKILAAALLAADPGHSNLPAVIAQSAQSVALLDSLPDRLNDAAAYRLAGAALLLNENRESDEKALPLLLRCERIAESQTHTPNPNDDVHRLLSLVYQRLGQSQQALAQAAAASVQEPMNPEVYRQLSATFVSQHQPDNAAVALMEGVFLTSDQSLRQDLLKLYSAGLDRAGCAIIAGPNGPAINPACESVHRDLCQAAADAIQLSQKIGRQDIAAGLQHGVGAQLGCIGGK